MKKYSTALFLIALAVLLLTQQKLVMPLIYNVIKSDLFLVDSKDKPSQLPVSSHLTDIAFKFCNQYIASKLPSGNTAAFSQKPINSWSLGNYQYVINAEVNITANNASNMKKYVCRIAYKNGDDQSGIENSDNWSINGIAGFDDE